MLRRLSVHVHASHMHVLYARRVYAGMAPAQADRAGGAQQQQQQLIIYEPCEFTREGADSNRALNDGERTRLRTPSELELQESR